MTRILITGSRDWYCPKLAGRILDRLAARFPAFVIVHGDARGVDRAFREMCDHRGIAHEPHPADWDRLGGAAGPVRNQAMIDLGAELCIAFAKDIRSSKGTAHCAGKAIAAGIPTYLIDSEDGEPRRITEISK